MIGLWLAAAAAPAVVYIERNPPNPKFTRVLFLRADGRYASWAGTVRPGPRGSLRRDMQRSYRTFCGQWRKDAAGNIVVRQRISESYGPIVPPAWTRWHEQRYAAAAPSTGLPAALVAGAAHFAQTTALPDALAELAGLRLQCDAIRGAP